MALSDLVVNLNGDAQGFRRASGEVRGGLVGLQRTSQTVAGGIKASFTGIAAALGPIGLALGGVAALGKSFSLGMELEATRAQFATLLGDMGAAKGLMAEIEGFSHETPFDTFELNEAAAGLLKFGRTQSQVIDDLQILGDVAAGTRVPLQELISIFGKAKATGVAQWEDLVQLIERGVPMEAFPEAMGVSATEVRALGSASKITFDDVRKALQIATGEGGRFHNAMATAADTSLAKWKKFQSGLAGVLAEIGTAIIEGFGFKDLLDEGNDFVATFRKKWMPEIQNGIGELGAVWQSSIEPALKSTVQALPHLIRLFGKAAEAAGFLARHAEELAFFVSIARGVIPKIFPEKEPFRLPDHLRNPEPPEPGNLGAGLRDDLAGPGPVGISRDDFKPNRAIEAGTQAAYEKIFSLMSGNQTKQAEKQIAQNSEKMVQLTGQLLLSNRDLKRSIDKLLKKQEPEVAFAP